MFEWTEELKAEVIDRYKKAEPTGDNTIEILQEIAEDIGATPNGVRMILVKDGCYVRKTAADNKPTTSSGESKKVSKAAAHEALNSAIRAKGLEPDEDIVGKLTGKAALYFAEILA